MKPIRSETLHLNTFGDNKYRKQSCNVVKLRLQKQGNEEIEITALNFPVICSPLPAKVEINCPHLEGLELADNFDILIGSDHYWEIVTGDIVKGKAGPTAVSSKLGWLLSGPLPESSTPSDNTVLSSLIILGNSAGDFGLAEKDDRLVQTLKQFWETKSIGIHEPRLKTEDEKEEFMAHIKHNGERYEIGLPWKDDSLPIPSHYQQSYNRLRSLHHELKKEPQVLQEYDKIFENNCKQELLKNSRKTKTTTRIVKTYTTCPITQLSARTEKQPSYESYMTAQQNRRNTSIH